MFPFLIELSTIWGRAFYRLVSLLLKLLDKDLLMVAALSSEEPLLYEGNVLIVVRERRPELIARILELKREVEREFSDRITISPIIATPEDTIVERFMALEGRGFERSEGQEAPERG